MDLRRTEPWQKSPILDRKAVSTDERDKPKRKSVEMRCADHEGGSKPERTQALLYGRISQKRCTESVRSCGKTHLFGRRDSSSGKKVALMWPSHKQETKMSESMMRATQKSTQQQEMPQQHHEPGGVLRSLEPVRGTAPMTTTP